MSTVYSKRLAASVFSAGLDQLIYTVPVGFVTVVRDVEVVQFTAAACTTKLGIHGIAYFVVLPTTTIDQHLQWQGRVVMKASEIIQLDQLVAEASVVISGYELPAT